jgi:hypothetical protein
MTALARKNAASIASLLDREQERFLKTHRC